MKYLVTGGAGFIGSNLVDAIIEKGHQAVCVDNESAESNSKFYWNEHSKNYPIDICDYDALKWVFRHEEPDVILHLAAEARIQPTIDAPQLACNVNFVGTCNVLQACREYNVERFVYSSTSSSYGCKNTPPLRENMVKDCLNPYSVSKAAGEDLCKVYYHIYGVETVILRYFNVYGNREPRKGHYAPVIGLFLRLKEEGKPMTIVGDGTQSRDFTHVSDVVNANILASTTQNSGAFGQVFNVGTGKSYTILEIAGMIGGDVEHIEDRKGEAKHTLADLTKSKEMFGYEPQKNLETYIQEKKNGSVL
jgi:UDP-glucose 4-epimerase